VIASCLALRRLALPHNRIGDQGIAALMEGFYLNISLTALDLSHNVIADTVRTSAVAPRGRNFMRTHRPIPR